MNKSIFSTGELACVPVERVKESLNILLDKYFVSCMLTLVHLNNFVLQPPSGSHATEDKIEQNFSIGWKSALTYNENIVPTLSKIIGWTLFPRSRLFFGFMWRRRFQWGSTLNRDINSLELTKCSLWICLVANFVSFTFPITAKTAIYTVEVDPTQIHWKMAWQNPTILDNALLNLRF